MQLLRYDFDPTMTEAIAERKIAQLKKISDKKAKDEALLAKREERRKKRQLKSTTTVQWNVDLQMINQRESDIGDNF